MDQQTERSSAPPVHPLVAATERCLREAGADRDGILHTTPASAAFDVSVAAASVSRAIGLIDAFLRRTPAEGIEVSIGAPQRWDPRRQTIATVDGEALAIRLTERRRQRAHAPTADEDAAAKPGSFMDPPKWDYRPSGVLSLGIRDALGAWGERFWADGKRAPLEGKLDLVIAGLHELANAMKASRRRQEEGRVAAMEPERLAAPERNRLSKEQEFRDTLLAKAEDWRRSRLLRRYVRQVQNHALARGGHVENGRLSSWVERALGVADSLDSTYCVDTD